MENETGSQIRETVSGYSYEELLKKLKSGDALSDDELEDIVCEVVFESIGNSNSAMEEAKTANGIRVSLLTLVGKMCGRQTKFLPFALDYRKKAALYNQDHYDRVLDRAKLEVNTENVLLLVHQLEAANRYRDEYRTLDTEIEECIDDGLGSFRGIVGLETMISMDREHDNILRLTRRRKPRVTK